MAAGVCVVNVVFLFLANQMFQELNRLYCLAKSNPNEISNYTKSFRSMFA